MKQEVDLLDDDDKWIKSSHNTKESLFGVYPNAILVMISDKYKYYYAVKSQLLHRVLIRPTMTKAEAERKYDITIED
jgi:hypothetical protein